MWKLGESEKGVSLAEVWKTCGKLGSLLGNGALLSATNPWVKTLDLVITPMR